MESEGHEEKYRAVIDGETQDEPVGQRWGKVESALLRRRRSHSPTAPRCLRAARYRRTARDLRRTDRVSGWHRSKQTYKRKRNGQQRSVSSRTAEQYLKHGESHATGQPATEFGSGKAAGEDGQEEKGNQMSKEEKGGLDQPNGCKEGPFINRQSVQAEEPGDGLGEGESEPGKWRCRWAESR